MDKMSLKMRDIDFSKTGIPLNHQKTIIDYVKMGLPMGDFLTSLFANDLVGCFMKADNINKFLIYDYVKLLYNHLPMNCHGSYEKVNEWMRKKQNKPDNNKEN